MKNRLKALGGFLATGCTLSLLSAVLSGCASNAYLKDRSRDAADIFTCVLGGGAGAAARVGPLQAGLVLQWGQFGLRGGELSPGSLETGELLTTIIPFHPDDRSITGRVFGLEQYSPHLLAQERGKGFKSVSRFPFVTTELRSSSWVDRSGKGQTVQPGPYPYYYWTQLDAFIGVALGLRVGFNPGELLDFILGWVTIDIYGDDIGLWERGG